MIGATSAINAAAPDIAVMLSLYDDTRSRARTAGAAAFVSKHDADPSWSPPSAGSPTADRSPGRAGVASSRPVVATAAGPGHVHTDRAATSRLAATTPGQSAASATSAKRTPARRAGSDILSFMRRAVDELGQTIVMVTHDPVAAGWSTPCWRWP